MFKRILVAVDGSPTANLGLKSAIELAVDQHAELYIVHVIDDLADMFGGEGGYLPNGYKESIMESLRGPGRKLIAETAAIARKRGLDVHPLLVETPRQSVAQTILAQARQQKADVIVLGTHGRRGLRRLLLGSDAETVVRESPVPVLLVRSPGREKPQTNSGRPRGRASTTARPAGRSQTQAAR